MDKMELMLNVMKSYSWQRVPQNGYIKELSAINSDKLEIKLIVIPPVLAMLTSYYKESIELRAGCIETGHTLSIKVPKPRLWFNKKIVIKIWNAYQAIEDSLNMLEMIEKNALDNAIIKELISDQ